MSTGQMTRDLFGTIFEPFIKLMGTTKDARIREECSKFLRSLIDQTDIALEYWAKFHAWKKAGCPGGDVNLMVKVDTESEPESDDDVLDCPENTNNPLDPRAGHVDVYLPTLPVYCSLTIKLLNKFQDSCDSTLKGKRLLRYFIQIFQVLKKGRYPFTMKKVKRERFGGKRLIDACANKLLKKTSVKKRTPPRKHVKKEIKVVNKGVKKIKNTEKPTGNCKVPEEPIDFPENAKEQEISPTKKKKLSPIKFDIEPVLVNSPLKRKRHVPWEIDDVDEGANSEKVIIVEEKMNNEQATKEEMDNSTLHKKRVVPTPIFWDHVREKVSKKQPQKSLILTPTNRQLLEKSSSNRRISFNLQKNQAQEDHEYLEEVQKSPQVPFDSAKKPKHSALKPGLSPTPINPFYMVRRKLV